MKVCTRYLVSGRVQGVFFRASAREQALARGLTGWARNLPNGSVEVVACGVDTELKALHDWLWAGPARARVTEVRAEPVEWLDINGFETR